MVLSNRIKETLPDEVLKKMYAPGQSKDIPFATPEILEGYDAFLFGIPTRYGNFPAQWKAFWDSTGQQWQRGAYWGKYAGVFVSTAAPGGGQESTVIASLSTLTHHGIVYVPLGYKHTFSLLADLSEVHGGSPWGAGTFAVSFFPCWIIVRQPNSPLPFPTTTKTNARTAISVTPSMKFMQLTPLLSPYPGLRRLPPTHSQRARDRQPPRQRLLRDRLSIHLTRWSLRRGCHRRCYHQHHHHHHHHYETAATCIVYERWRR